MRANLTTAESAWYALHDKNGEPLGGFRKLKAARQAQVRFPGSKLTKLNLHNLTPNYASR